MRSISRMRCRSHNLLLYALLWSGRNASSVGAAAARLFLLQEQTHTGPAAAVPENVVDNQHISQQKKLPLMSIVVGVISAVIALILLALAVLGYLQNRFQLKVRRRGGVSISTKGARKLEKFSLQELQAATVSFTQKLGREGCAGAVFKGILPNCKEVAVKLVDDYTPSEFESEVQRVSALTHENLIQILGYCTDGDHCFLVQEFCSNGSLRGVLYSAVLSPSTISLSSSSRSSSPNVVLNKSWSSISMSSKSSSPNAVRSKSVLSWRTRFDIALGTAKALAYVHGACSAGMNIHGRIKPENVLLTETLNPRLGDCGFLRCRRKRDHDLTLATAQGTLEYFAPEWWTDPTTKCDVYSFGILLLEIVSGRRIGEFYDRPQWEFPELNEEEQDTGGDSRPALSSRSMELLDPELKGEVNMIQCTTVLRVAYWCIQYEAPARPTMSQVVDYLENRLTVSCPPTPSSSAVFTPLHLSYSASLEAFGFRSANGPEIVKAH